MSKILYQCPVCGETALWPGKLYDATCPACLEAGEGDQYMVQVWPAPDPWVSVEKPPEAGVMVLVWGRESGQGKDWHPAFFWGPDNWDALGNYPLVGVTHWKPGPQPPMCHD